MAIIEPGRVEARSEDTGGRYLIDEQTELDWRLLVEAMRSAAALCDGFDPDSSDFDAGTAAALFHVFARHGATLAAEAKFSPAKLEKMA